MSFDKNNNKNNNKNTENNIFTNIWFILILSLVFLIIGILGFYIFNEPIWTNSIYNASTIMSIVGATYAPKTDSGKIFASIYSLAAGLIYVFIMGYFVLSKIIKNYQKL